MKEIYTLIENSVNASDKPAILLSGGLDSTILLHHLISKTNEKIYTYTMFQENVEESEEDKYYSEKIAKYYNTVHKSIKISNFLDVLHELLPLMDRPRWNIWPYWCYKEASKDKKVNIYIGEGFDEHFGGYWYKTPQTYQEYWSGVIEWSIPIHKIFCKKFGMNLETPFLTLPVEKTIAYWDPKNEKTYLREIYKGEIPEFTRIRRKNPGRLDFISMWDKEFKPYIHKEKPKTREESYSIINRYATEKWLELTK